MSTIAPMFSDQSETKRMLVKPEHLAFVKDMSFDICKAAGDCIPILRNAQAAASQWNDATHKGHLFDRQHVAIACREAAQKLNELATQIEESSR